MPWEPDYVTRDEYKTWAQNTHDADDAAIDVAIGMASRAVDKQAGRQFGQVAAPEAREYTARFSRSRGAIWYVEVDDFPDLAGASVAWDSAGDGTFATTVNLTDCVPWPRNAPQNGRPYERLMFRPSAPVSDGRAYGVRPTIRWGWTAVPTSIKGAVRLQVNRMHARRDAPFGVAGSPDQGSEIRLLAKLDPDVAVAVERFRRRAWAR